MSKKTISLNTLYALATRYEHNVPKIESERPIKLIQLADVPTTDPSRNIKRN